MSKIRILWWIYVAVGVFFVTSIVFAGPYALADGWHALLGMIGVGLMLFCTGAYYLLRRAPSGRDHAKPGRWTKLLLCVTFCFLVILMIVRIPDDYHNAARSQIANTKYFLKEMRQCVDWFKGETSHYPDTLSEIKQYVKEQQIDTHRKNVNYLNIFGPYTYREQISMGVFSLAHYHLGEVKIHQELDGSGGWYYDNATGQVKVNVTRPVKHFMMFYRGPYRDDIPADW